MSYIKLDRKMLEWEWFGDPMTSHLWIYMLLKANHEEKHWQGICVPEGCLLTSVQRMSNETGMSVQQTRTAIRKLESTNEISRKTTNNYTLIRVNKWKEYQTGNKQATRNTTVQATTPKEVKEDKNIVHSSCIYGHFQKPTIDEVRAYCKERNNGVDSDRWFNYYEANGWKVGKNAMKDWKAAVRTWEKNSPKKHTENLPTYDTSANKEMSVEEEEELLTLMGKI